MKTLCALATVLVIVVGALAFWGGHEKGYQDAMWDKGSHHFEFTLEGQHYEGWARPTGVTTTR